MMLEKIVWAIEVKQENGIMDVGCLAGNTDLLQVNAMQQA